MLFRGSLDRQSLALSVLEIPSQADRLAWLAEHLPQLPGAGIVYCLTVGDADRVASWLQANGIDARAYSGRADPEERWRSRMPCAPTRSRWWRPPLGMGFDWPSSSIFSRRTRQSPTTSRSAGPAAPWAEVVLLCGAEDRSIWEWFASTAFPPRDQVATVLGAETAGGPMSTGLLEEVANLSRSRLELMLKVLDVEGAVRRVAKGWERADTA